jgi:hypothetical protein
MIFRTKLDGPTTGVSVTEVILARAPRALEGEVRGGSSLEGAGKGRLWRKGSRKGVDRDALRVNAFLFPSFLPLCVSKPHRRQPNGSLRL